MPNYKKERDNNLWKVYSTINSSSEQHSTKKKKYIKKSNLLLLPSYNKPFAGSSLGWLATLDNKFAVTLHKPQSNNNNKSIIIILPPLFPPRMHTSSHPYWAEHIYRFTIFKPNPISNPKDFIMVVIYGSFLQLAYIRPSKHNKWIRIPSLFSSSSSSSPTPSIETFEDVLYYKDTLYALLHKNGRLVSFDITYDSTTQQSLKLLVGPSIPRDKKSFCYKKYLVESYKDQLLQVQKYVKYNKAEREQVTIKFRVFKLNNDRSRWVEVEELEDEALFLGDNESLSVKVSSANSTECDSNCIYFLHDKNTTGRFDDDGPLDSGVYNLKTRSFVRRFNVDKNHFSKMGGRIPIWISED
ncbi:putative F-box protein At5g60060 [Cannabis sativa]|uniref:putative F-box protein At5g60060 n=1 Tax=Cannabis sativa TaxID=3483 RepID=UPI0029CA0889|nr:putative F-box protein At5g60060 [Cannabis sativa]